MRMFGFKKGKVKRKGENYVMRSLMICIPHTILFGCYNREEIFVACRV